MRLVRLSLLLLILFVFFGCDRGGSADTAQSPSPETSQRKPADSQAPTSGVCPPPPSGKFVEYTLNPDSPEPRCSKARGDQQVRFTNKTGFPVDVALGQIQFTLQNGQSYTIELDLNQWLERGVHSFESSYYAGGPELWLE